jgi:hypothetical protein
MSLRATTRKKDGREHTYFSVVENKRVADGRVVQRHVLYLGEINSTQEFAWRRSIEVLDEAQKAPRTLALFPDDRYEAVVDDETVVRLKLSRLRLERPRQWGGVGSHCSCGGSLSSMSSGPSACQLLARVRAGIRCC